MNSFDLDYFNGKDVIFVGAGKGRALAGFQSFLGKHGAHKSFKAVDKSNDGSLDFLKTYDLESTVFVKNEGVPGYEMPVPYITQLQLFFDLVESIKSLTIGITGTKGKSTTASLTAHIIKEAGKKVILAGNIGTSPLEALSEADENTIFVLELSSYQLSDLKKSPKISACLNLYNDHSDWHGSVEAYWEAKHNIMRFAPADGLFIYNASFPALKEWAASATCRTMAIDVSEDLSLDKSKLYGEHNRLNALVARYISRELGITDQVVQQAIDNFTPLEHRMEFVANTGKHIYIDDAIGMTPESTMASLEAVMQKYGQIGCLLLGGQDRDYDFNELMQAIADANIQNLVMFPDTIEKMKHSLPEGYSPTVFETDNMTEAVQFAHKYTPENSVVLLSTAAPSYSLWSDFEEKGKQFKEAVYSIEK